MCLELNNIRLCNDLHPTSVNFETTDKLVNSLFILCNHFIASYTLGYYVEGKLYRINSLLAVVNYLGELDHLYEADCFYLFSEKRPTIDFLSYIKYDKKNKG